LAKLNGMWKKIALSPIIQGRLLNASLKMTISNIFFFDCSKNKTDKLLVYWYYGKCLFTYQFLKVLLAITLKKIKRKEAHSTIYTVGFCGGKPPHFYPISGDPHLIPPF
jgi:hypothetical protein